MNQTSGSEYATQPRTRRQFNVDTGVIVSEDTVDLRSEERSWVRGSSTSPNFPKVLRENAFKYQEIKKKFPVGTHTTLFNSKPYITYEGVLTGLPGVYLFEASLPSPSVIEDARRKSEDKLLDNVKAQSVNVMVAAGERKQTARMVTSLALNAMSAISLAKARDLRGLRQLLFGDAIDIASTTKLASNMWLTWVYGIKPLISDIRGAVKEIQRIEGQGDSPQIIRVSGKGQVDVTKFVAQPTYTRQTVGKVQFKTWATFEVSVAHKYVRLGLTNVLSALYELTTLSFVVDWFIDIGGFLSRLDATIGCRYIGGGQTKFTRITEVTTSISSTPYIDALGIYTLVDCERVAKSDFPNPHLPRLDPSFSMSRVVSALALIRQRL